MSRLGLRVSKAQWAVLAVLLVLSCASAVWTYTSSYNRAREASFITSASSGAAELAAVQRDSFTLSFSISEALSSQQPDPKSVAVARAVLQQRLDALDQFPSQVSLITPEYEAALAELDMLLTQVGPDSVVTGSSSFETSLRQANTEFVQATAALGTLYEQQVAQASQQVASARAVAERVQAGLYAATLLGTAGFIVWFVFSTRRQFTATQAALKSESSLLALESQSRRRADALSELSSVWVRVLDSASTITYAVTPHQDVDDSLLLPSSGSFADISRAVYPDDRDGLTEAYSAVAAGRTPLANLTVRMAGPTGLRTVEMSVRDLRGLRDVDGIVLLARDVTGTLSDLSAMQAASAVSELLVASSTHGVLLQNPSGGFTSANDSLTTLLGLPVSAGELVALPPAAANRVVAAAATDPDAFAARVDEVTAAGMPVTGEIVEFGPAGSVVLERDFTPVATPDGQVRLWMWAYRDVTAAMSAIREVTAQRDDALTSSRFLTAAGHELRTPLSVITGYAQLLESSLTGPDLDAAHAIYEAADSMSSLVNDILTVSAASDASPATTTVDVAEAVAHAVSQVRSTDPDLKVRWSVDASVSTWVLDEARFARAVAAATLHAAALAAALDVTLEVSAHQDLSVLITAAPAHRPPDTVRRGVASLGLGARLAEQILAPERGVVTVLGTEEGVRLRLDVPAASDTKEE